MPHSPFETVRHTIGSARENVAKVALGATIVTAVVGGASYIASKHYESEATQASSTAQAGTPHNLEELKPDQQVTVDAGTLQAYQHERQYAENSVTANDVFLGSVAGFSIFSITTLVSAVGASRRHALADIATPLD